MEGRRFSHQRELIYQAVCSTTQHPTAEMIYEQLQREHPKLSRGTVYRNLNLLEEEGLIWKMPFPVERFDARVQPHPHLFCRSCEQVTDLFLDYDWNLDSLASSKYGCDVEKHDLIFYGVCASCKKNHTATEE